MREVTMNMLSSDNVEFIECEDGGDAIIQYSRFKPDWVLMDLSMRAVGGLSAVSQLKKTFPDCRIIILTDYDESILREKAKSLGAFAYVLKENLHELPVIIKSSLH
jgi:CheY-like chemotaxis protein